MTIDKRIEALERAFRCTAAGTTINRMLSKSGLAWVIALGNMHAPKTFFEGKTIEEALAKAEKWAEDEGLFKQHRVVTTNDLKKGTRVLLRNGFYATLLDNRKGTTRLADVEGIVRESGSIYSHDIMKAFLPIGMGGALETVVIKHSASQKNLRTSIVTMFGG